MSSKLSEAMKLSSLTEDRHKVSSSTWVSLAGQRCLVMKEVTGIHTLTGLLREEQMI